MGKISIIIPIYNAERNIVRCIDSILHQTFIDFDLILVDDGSTDNSYNICKDYSEKDSRIVVIHQKNCGPSRARNTGLDWMKENSDSEYITFVDSDDSLHPKFLEYMYEAIKLNMAEISMCRHRYINGGETFREDLIIEKPEGVYRIDSAENLMVSHQDNFNYVWAKLFARECLDIIRFPGDKSFGEDNLVIYKVIFESKKVVMVDLPLYYYFYSPAGITKSKWSVESLQVFDGIKAQLQYYKENGYERAYRKEKEIYIQQCAYQMNRIYADKKNFKCNKNYYKKLRTTMKELLKKNPEFNLKENQYWKESFYPKTSRALYILKKLLHEFYIIKLLRYKR